MEDVDWCRAAYTCAYDSVIFNATIYFISECHLKLGDIDCFVVLVNQVVYAIWTIFSENRPDTQGTNSLPEASKQKSGDQDG